MCAKYFRKKKKKKKVTVKKKKTVLSFLVQLICTSANNFSLERLDYVATKFRVVLKIFLNS